jgi:SAM-dependent methyltransferase
MSCPGCSKKFRVSPDNNYFDLTVLPSQAHDDDPGSSVVSAVADALTQSTSNSNSSEKDLADAYKEKLWSVSKLFQSPVISYVYERGWRQGFDWAGFPGADEEFALLQKLYFGEGGGSLAEANKEEREGDEKRSVLDVSCGTGLFSRKFLKSGKFETIVASDYSENMLKQAYSFLEKEEDSKDAAAAAANNGTEIDPSVLLVRADVGRLPFPSKTFDLVHAGAAIHCWPTPSLGMAEITRVLKPGGKIIGSTFLLSASPLGQRLGSDDLVRPLFEIERELSGGMLPALTGRNYRFWEERELKALCSLCGLDHFRVERDNRFIMFCATKPDRKET